MLENKGCMGCFDEAGGFREQVVDGGSWWWLVGGVVVVVVVVVEWHWLGLVAATTTGL